MRTLPALLLCLPLLACGGDDDDSSEPTPEVIPDFVRATVRLTDTAGGGPLEGAVVSFDAEEATTDAKGRADLTVPTLAPFEITVDAGAEFPGHVLAGLVGGDDFIFASPITSYATTSLIYDGLGLVADPARGTLVVALNTIALQAASGALADIDVGSDAPFIVVNDVAQAGNELIFEADAPVTFPNVDVGDVTISITNPEGAICVTFPALEADDLRTFEVRADAVTVVVFICQ